MGLRALVIHPDPVLRVDCSPVVDFDANLRDLAADMLDTMYAAFGRGLAAPQVGMTCRLFVTDFGWKDGTPDPRVFVNPVLTWASGGLQVYEEACLSLPDQPRRIARPAEVDLDWQDLAGRHHQARFIGVPSVIVQHEADHLDGVLILDHPPVPLPAPKAPA
jgi:peptide deformylase